MTRIVLRLGVALALLAGLAPSLEADDRAASSPVALENLPRIPVRIANDTDATLSLTVSSAPCAPRLFLGPRTSTLVADCFRWGLVYQTVAVFYDQRAVHERQWLLFLAKPGQDWTFYEPR